MALKRAKCDPNGSKTAIFFRKITKIFKQLPMASGGWGPLAWPPSVMRLSYISFFAVPPQFNTYFEKIINCCFKSSILATSC